MPSLENAKTFFHACESAQGWEACRQYVSADASFHSAAGTYAEIHTLEAYCEQVRGAFTSMFDSRYELHDVAHNPDSNTAYFYGTSYIRYTGKGGPDAPAGKEAAVPFVYIMTLDKDGKVSHLEKIFDQESSRNQLGWSKN